MRQLLILVTAVTISHATQAQSTVPNLNFEDWTLSNSGRYENPNPQNIWATPNYAIDLVLGNISTSIVQKSSDVRGIKPNVQL